MCLLWSNVEKYIESDRPHKTVWRTRIACWVPKATNTHSVYVTLTAFPVQQRVNKRASMLDYSYNTLACCLYWLKDEVLRSAVVNRVRGEMYATRTDRQTSSKMYATRIDRNTCISVKIPVFTHMFCSRL